MIKNTFLILVLFLIAGCSVTGHLWDDYSKKVIARSKGDAFSVALLESGRIAVYTHEIEIKDKDRSDFGADPQLRNLAFIYEFDVNAHPDLSRTLVRAHINESVTISFSKEEIIEKKSNFYILLENGVEIKPELVDVTMTDRSTEQEIRIDNNKVSYSRVIRTAGKEFMADTSFLYRVPITPVAVSIDAAQVTAITSAGLVGLTAFGTFLAIVCSLDDGPCW